MRCLLAAFALLAAARAARADVTAPGPADPDLQLQRALLCPRPPAPGRTLVELEGEYRDGSRPMAAADLYDLGVLLLRADRAADARARFLVLIKNHPLAPEIEDAYLQFGDELERRADTEAALRIFERFSAMPRARCGAYARYRYGRLALQLGQEKQGRTALTAVAHSPASTPPLRAAALRLLDLLR